VQGTFASRAGARGFDLALRRRVRNAIDGLAALLGRRDLRPLWWLLVVLASVAPMVRAARLPGPRLPPPTPGRGQVGRLRQTVRAWHSRPDADYRRPARQLAQHLTRTVELADHQVQRRRRALDAPRPATTLHEALGRLVADGHLAAAAGQRIKDLVGVLEEVAERGALPVGRERFTELAAEVDWAEQVLSHTTATSAAHVNHLTRR